MNRKIIVAAIMVISIFLFSCTQGQSNYQAYNKQQQQPQSPAVGGGCGVAPNAQYKSTTIKSLNSAGSEL